MRSAMASGMQRAGFRHRRRLRGRCSGVIQTIKQARNHEPSCVARAPPTAAMCDFRLVQTGQSQALAGLAHSVHVEVQGLEADRWYFYRFAVGDAVSATGRTHTFPAPDAAVARLRLAYASCQRWEHGYFSAYRHMRD